ncbi:hypothetical protein [Actinophytocola sp. NPDC049390]|uniref:hypothetical protein n=1 Tax=Actinophytocola sp. NPDC049390 TaxID=3363894 RepID=UPI0037B0D6F2
MDSVLIGSLEVLCDSELSDPRLFFTALDEVCQAGDNTDFEAFRTAFTERANRDGFTEPGELFVRHLADNGGADTVRKFADEGADNLVREYERLLSEPEPEPEPAGNPAAYDESVWVAFVAEFGASWNGAAETWDAFRTWFLYHAEERGVAAPATDFLDYAEGESDRVAFFARYGVTIDVAASDEAPAEEDPEVWQAFLAEYGPVWNGAEENWASFTPYFLHYAEERGVTGFAAAFLENAPDDNDARVQYFATYGVVTGTDTETDTETGTESDAESDAGTDTDDAAPEPVTAEQIADAAQQFAQLADESDHVPDEHEDTVAEAFAELVNQMPEAANLSPEQMRELLATIPQEHL